jgi:hypothetical protein
MRDKPKRRKRQIGMKYERRCKTNLGVGHPSAIDVSWDLWCSCKDCDLLYAKLTEIVMRWRSQSSDHA